LLCCIRPALLASGSQLGLLSVRIRVRVWAPLQTNTLTRTNGCFTDPEASPGSGAFHRALWLK